FNEEGESIETAPHPSMKFSLPVPYEVREGDILRM
ncbi:MAG: U32 family peptidase C-terminal domain-containing protein, partial [Ruminococcus sp.]|nr:U32 family peptidase C-terminal domain-containing protein [Candidatus Copronaster equi]